jgi:hypothetical protein
MSNLKILASRIPEPTDTVYIEDCVNLSEIPHFKSDDSAAEWYIKVQRRSGFSNKALFVGNTDGSYIPELVLDGTSYCLVFKKRA